MKELIRIGTQKIIVVQSEEYGIPQARHRILNFRIQSDIYTRPNLGVLKEEERFQLTHIIGKLPRLRVVSQEDGDRKENGAKQ